MSKIDISQWKEFKLSSMFDICYGSFVPKKDRGTKTPFITTSSENNGISYYVDSDPMFKGDALTVASDGSVGATFYHDKPFSAGNIVVVLEPHDDIRVKWTPKSALFIATCIRKYAQIRHSWTDKYSVNRVRDTMLPLPVDSSGQPDWQYMDSYIAKRASLAHKYVSELKSAKNQRNPLKISGWQEYKISQLFNVRPSNYIRENGKAISNLQLLNGGPNPVVVNSSVNNGIGGTTSYEPTEHGNVITYSDTVDGNTIFYQAKPFVGYSHVKVMEPKEKRNPTEMIFLTAVIGRRLSDGNYDYTNKMTTNRVLNTTIKLPALSDGTPDWATMRKRVAHLAALSHRDVTSLDPAELPIFVGNWHEYKIDDLFDVDTATNVLARWIDEDSGVTPYVTSSELNNGVKSLIRAKSDWINYGNCIFIGGKTFTVTYQKEDFVSNDSHNLILRLRDSVDDLLISNVYLFLASVIKLVGTDVYSWGDAVTSSRIKQLSIKLPVDSNGHPDWYYMNNYVKFMQSTSHRQLQAFKQVVH